MLSSFGTSTSGGQLIVRFGTGADTGSVEEMKPSRSSDTDRFAESVRFVGVIRATPPVTGARPITSPACRSVATVPSVPAWVEVTRTWNDGSPTGNEPGRCTNFVVNFVVSKAVGSAIRISMLGSPSRCQNRCSRKTWPVSCWVGPRGAAMYALPALRISPSRVIGCADPNVGTVAGNIASAQPTVSWSFCTVGLTSVSPMTATAPPPWRWSRRSAGLGLPGNWKPALEQLIEKTTGSSVLFEFRSPMSLMLMPGFAQPSRLPWSRWTNRKRPAFSSLTTWSRPSVHGVAGRLSSSGIGVCP